MATPEHALQGKRIAILADQGVEQSELERPRQALESAGAKTDLVSPRNEIRAWNHDQWGDTLSADVPLAQAKAEHYDALLVPGGVINADALRMNKSAVAFVRSFAEQGKPMAVICHGPWLLIEADVIGGRTVTSWPSLQTDLENTGAEWVDREVVVDQGLVTSRKPDDIPAFNAKMIEEFAEGEHAGQRRAAHASHREGNPPYTTLGPITVPKFGAAGSGGGEIEPGLPRN
ncbi:MAG TPA: type 1 glutamine amidotransferase domain-containing protein [Gemmatimonadaceae bacterium]|jgi:protease I|nr:type 1 glutamine amidotransferase domain-containing protein [Gemmatimonadaceae bacterium]